MRLRAGNEKLSAPNAAHKQVLRCDAYQAQCSLTAHRVRTSLGISFPSTGWIVHCACLCNSKKNLPCTAATDESRLLDRSAPISISLERHSIGIVRIQGQRRRHTSSHTIRSCIHSWIDGHQLLHGALRRSFLHSRKIMALPHTIQTTRSLVSAGYPGGSCSKFSILSQCQI